MTDYRSPGLFVDSNLIAISEEVMQNPSAARRDALFSMLFCGLNERVDNEQ